MNGRSPLDPGPAPPLTLVERPIERDPSHVVPPVQTASKPEPIEPDEVIIPDEDKQTDPTPYILVGVGVLGLLGLVGLGVVIIVSTRK